MSTSLDLLQHSKDKAIKKLGSWICTQQTNYKKKSHIMKEEAIRLKWEEFVSDD